MPDLSLCQLACSRQALTWLIFIASQTYRFPHVVDAVNARAGRPDYLFLDCEWADITAKELVSIGIASIDGTRTFYAELDPLPADPTPWVRAVVYPILERGEAAMTLATMAFRLRAFLATFERPLICYDYMVDRDLCEHVLRSQSEDHDQTGAVGLEWQLLSDVGPSLGRWWAEHPNETARRHHALADAFALRAAYLSLWGI